MTIFHQIVKQSPLKFTSIEVYISFLLFFILVMVIGPNLLYQRIADNRVEAQNLLLQYQKEASLYYQKNHTYTHFTLPPSSPSFPYKMALVTLPQHFTITAFPIGYQTLDNCFQLTIDDTALLHQTCTRSSFRLQNTTPP